MFGERIRFARKEKGLSVKDLAQRVRIDPSLLSRIENGQRAANKNLALGLGIGLDLQVDEVIGLWLQDKVYRVLDDYPDHASEVLKALESRVEYLSGSNNIDLPNVSELVRSKLKDIDELKSEWETVRPGRGIQSQKMQEFFGVDYTYESNRIEGNTLSLQETALVVKEGLTISGKSIKEHLEAINHDEAIEVIRDLTDKKLELTEYRIKQIHHLVLKGIDRRNAGVYRQVNVRISGSKHNPPEPFQINGLMEDMMQFYRENYHRMHPVILSAEMHERLVSIHPFVDGNGRTARLIMNMVLLRSGYTLAILKGSQKARLNYYRALEKVQLNNEPEDFYLLICDAIKESLEEHIKLSK